MLLSQCERDQVSLSIDHSLQINPQKKIKRCQIRTSWGPLHWPSTTYPMFWKLPVQPIANRCAVMCRSTVLFKTSRAMAIRIQYAGKRFLLDHPQVSISIVRAIEEQWSDYYSIIPYDTPYHKAFGTIFL